MLNKQSGGKESQGNPPADVLFNHFKALSTYLNNTKMILVLYPVSPRNPGMQIALMMISHHRKLYLQ